MKHNSQQAGFSAVIAVVAVLVIAGLGFAAWRISQAPEDKKSNKTSQEAKTTPAKTEIDDWTVVTSQGGMLTMKVPDGWKLTNYPGDFLGGTEIVHSNGMRAQIEESQSEYAGHSLVFRAAVSELDDAGLGPQWASPQAGLKESNQDFAIGSLKGKRYKGEFSGDLDQTIYEYIFAVGENKKLDIVYTVDHARNVKDDIATVEKAINSVQLNN